mgnify:CR=1 FL=1
MINKKSQMEALGLAVIVILLSLGMFFMISLSNSAEKMHKDFSDTQTIKNLLTSMKRTNLPPCSNGNLDLGEILANCAEKGGLWTNLQRGDNAICSESGSTISTCLFANKTIAYMLNKTIGVQELNYHFKVYEYSSNGINEKTPANWVINLKDNLGLGCPIGVTDKITAIQPIPLGGTSIFMSLSVCD